jgi:hypothetical protein
MKRLRYVFVRNFIFQGKPDCRRRTLPGDDLVFHGLIRNIGLRRGTVYVRVLVFDPYECSRVVFDSHVHLSNGERRLLRRAEIRPLSTAGFACAWKVPEGLQPGVYYTAVELWTPATLLAPGSTKYPSHRFRCAKLGWPEVVALQGSPPRRVFVTYSWDPDRISFGRGPSKHQKWVMALCDELTRNGLSVVVDRYAFLPGQRLRELLAQDRNSFDAIVLVCSERYTRRANEPITDPMTANGVQIETALLSEEDFFACAKDRFVPVIRNNRRRDRDRLPSYLQRAGILYEDMEGVNWSGLPLQRVVSRIKQIPAGG